MKIFICYRSSNAIQSEQIIEELLHDSERSIVIQLEAEHSDNWKTQVEDKIKEVDFVLFLVDENTFESNPIQWEYALAKKLNKPIVGIKLSNSKCDNVLYNQGFHIFDNSKSCLKYLQKFFEDHRQLQLEQYKIMVGSTEKVTEQRLKVHNLFFTITSSILSVAFIFCKTFNYSSTGIIGAFLFTILAFLISCFWERLIRSYGKLNKGKFIVIDKIEKQLRTNMFEEEWNVLKHEIKYEPNTETEAKIVQQFRSFIIFIMLVEVIYFIYLLMK